MRPFPSVFIALLLTCSISCADGDDGEGEPTEGEGEGEGQTEAPRAVLCADTLAIDFGDVAIGSTRDADLVVTNCGDRDTDVLLVNAAGDFIVTALDCTRLAVGASCNV